MATSSLARILPGHDGDGNRRGATCNSSSPTARPSTEGQDFGVFADQTWRLGDLGAKHALLLAGIGWGNMPAAMVRADLQSGRLVRLDLPDWRGGTFTMHLLHAAGARRVLPGDG